MNAEVDSTVGPILKVYADRARRRLHLHRRRRAGRGDEPLPLRRQHRLQAGADGPDQGLPEPLPQSRHAAGIRREAPSRSRQMVASFADGSKLAIESTIIGNATGFRPGMRGMHGHHCTHVKDLLTLFSVDDFATAGWSTSCSAPSRTPAPSSWATTITRSRSKYMSYFKMGDGPLYMFYTPYHLPHLQLPHSRRARGAVPRSDADAARRTGVRRGLDRQAGPEGRRDARRHGRLHLLRPDRHLRESASARTTCRCRCRSAVALTRDVPKDQPIRYADVVLPSGRLCDQLRAEQTVAFRRERRARGLRPVVDVPSQWRVTFN